MLNGTQIGQNFKLHSEVASFSVVVVIIINFIFFDYLLFFNIIINSLMILEKPLGLQSSKEIIIALNVPHQDQKRLLLPWVGVRIVAGEVVAGLSGVVGRNVGVQVVYSIVHDGRDDTAAGDVLLPG